MQKTDLIAELKRTKDIPGIKKMKVEMAQVEKTQEQNLMSEISKAFNVTNFVDQVSNRNRILLFTLLKQRMSKVYRKDTNRPSFLQFSSRDLRVDLRVDSRIVDSFHATFPHFADPGERQLGKCDTDLEAADVGPKSRRTSEEGARGANCEGERGEAAESDSTVEAAATRQEG